jgi:hypothetical protein
MNNQHPNQPYKRHGDKINSDFFEEYLLKIYHERDKSGLTENILGIEAIVVQVEPSAARSYIAELMLMTQYNYNRSFEDEHFRYHVLKISEKNPDMLVREPLTEAHDMPWTLNNMSVNGKKKPYTRYIGEILGVQDLSEVVAKQKEKNINFVSELPQDRSQGYVQWTTPSIYTWNSTGYSQTQSDKQYDQLKDWTFSKEDLGLFKEMKDLQKSLGINKYIEPYDHLATRVFMHDREHALLEFISLSSYYLWGAFNIGDQNSSTNIIRSVKFTDERHSPAKVFTANNTPYYTCHIDDLPSPTENFVRDFGRRMHHLAVGVKDGFIGPEEDDIKNVDFVVAQLKSVEKEFLAHVIGSCDEGLKQIFSKKSEFSWLITEYIQRCYGYEGFFTKENVAALTKAAGEDDLVT